MPCRQTGRHSTQTHQDDDPEGVIDKDSRRHPEQEGPHYLVRLCVCAYVCVCMYVCACECLCIEVRGGPRAGGSGRGGTFFFDLNLAHGGVCVGVCDGQTDRQATHACIQLTPMMLVMMGVMETCSIIREGEAAVGALWLLLA